MLGEIAMKEITKPTESALLKCAKDMIASDILISDLDKSIVRDVEEKNDPIKNKQDGLNREADVESELEKKYPKEDGYEILSEVYLRDENGNIVKDTITGEARRIDFVVVKDGQVVDSIEVTSLTADKTQQVAKENRIRESGGNFIKGPDGNLIEIPQDVQTRIERRP